MIVHARISTVIDGEPVHVGGAVELKHGATLKHLLRKADKALGLSREKYFKRAFKQPLAPTVLLNGDRIDEKDALRGRLTDGDEVTIIVGLSGG